MSGCDLLRINYLCGRITNPPLRWLSARSVVICSELTTFAVESPTPPCTTCVVSGCDLLRINYLCGRITNLHKKSEHWKHVVICSELTTFAVESPTLTAFTLSEVCCDLLRINYLCGRITNERIKIVLRFLVVICSELTTFAVESPTLAPILVSSECCDLLRINYLCGRITNSCAAKPLSAEVVICSELTTFAVESPTRLPWLSRRKCCDLLRINYLCGRITN